MSQHRLAHILKHWPSQRPFIILNGSGAYTIIALSWDELSTSEAMALSLTKPGASAQPLLPLADARPRCGTTVPLSTGLIALLAYDAGAVSRYFWVRSACIIDNSENTAYLSGDGAANEAWLASLWAASSIDPKLPPAAAPFTLIPTQSDGSYLQQVKGALAAIAAGDYYQINLLRRFRFAATAVAPTFASLVARQLQWSGPYGAIVRIPGLELFSFSPERFVALETDVTTAMARLRTWPIKGSRPVHADPQVDAALIADLESHPKDRAELAMIVDLMRNDLQRLSQSGSVKVNDPGSHRRFRGIHHLVAEIESRAKPELDLGTLQAALCPGGSITGAPKRAAMQAIAAIEGEARGYFMGNILVWNAQSARLDSSILIRTVVRQDGGEYAYAAGSGIVTKSDPAAELQEVWAKCSVLNAL